MKINCRFMTSASAISGILMVAAAFSACDTKAKQKAILAIDAAKLSISDATTAKAGEVAPVLMKEAESDLYQAQKALLEKEYSTAARLGESAAIKAKDAAAQAKKKAEQKRAKSAKKRSF